MHSCNCASSENSYCSMSCNVLLLHDVCHISYVDVVNVSNHDWCSVIVIETSNRSDLIHHSLHLIHSFISLHTSLVHSNTLYYIFTVHSFVYNCVKRVTIHNLCFNSSFHSPLSQSVVHSSFIIMWPMLKKSLLLLPFFIALPSITTAAETATTVEVSCCDYQNNSMCEGVLKLIA